MSFFAMPAWEPPSGYRIPAWLRPPETMVPGIVPVELLLGRTGTDAVLVTDLRAYPTGLAFALTVRPRPDRPRPRRPDPDRSSLPLRHHDLGLELRFADGHTASNYPGRWPRSFETQEPDPPFLYCHGGGCEGGWRSPHWLWGLPRPGRWPSSAPGRPANSRRPASRSTPTWSWRPPIEPSGSGRPANRESPRCVPSPHRLGTPR